jgi:hypothetical protein
MADNAVNLRLHLQNQTGAGMLSSFAHKTLNQSPVTLPIKYKYRMKYNLASVKRISGFKYPTVPFIGMDRFNNLQDHGQKTTRPRPGFYTNPSLICRLRTVILADVFD